MSIGSTIKRLRREKDITQEQLAEYLGISSRAISQWECDRTAPDISQLPALCHIFGVSSDVLLGIDAAHLQEKVEKYKGNISLLYKEHRYPEMLELAREAVRTFPNSMVLIGQLAFALTSGDNAAKAENVDEAILLHKRILDGSVDNVLRFRSTAALCRLYAEKKADKKQACFYANQLPKGHIQTASYLLGHFDLLDDAEKEEFYREWIEQYTVALTDTMYSLADPNRRNASCTLTTAEKITLLTQITDITKIIFGKDLLSRSRESYEIHKVIGRLWLLENNNNKALDHFELAFEHARAFDAYQDGSRYTSVALSGLVCDEHNLWDCSAMQDMLEWLTATDLATAFRSDTRYEKLVRQIKCLARKS